MVVRIVPHNGGVDATGDNHVTERLSMTSPLIPLASNDLLYAPSKWCAIKAEYPFGNYVQLFHVRERIDCFRVQEPGVGAESDNGGASTDSNDAPAFCAICRIGMAQICFAFSHRRKSEATIVTIRR